MAVEKVDKTTHYPADSHGERTICLRNLRYWVGDDLMERKMSRQVGRLTCPDCLAEARRRKRQGYPL